MNLGGVSTPDSPRVSPETKAQQLLLSYLSPEQRRTYALRGFFYVRARDGEIYALYDGVYAALINKKTGKAVVRFGCYVIAPDVSLLPRDDRLLGQLLLLETNPWLFKKIACRQRCYDLDHKLDYGRSLKYFLRATPPARWPAVNGLFGAR